MDDRKQLDSAPLGQRVVRPGDRVRLRPRGRADIFDLVLAGKTGVVHAIEKDFEDRVYLSVLVDDDPGRDLGLSGQPGHRFFYGLDEVELVDAEAGS